jgi:ubiquinone/menaquinone biosynthesis C-methylase UbiE
MRVAPEELQHRFYTNTAAAYHADFVRPDDEHYRALTIISALIDGFGYRSVLDVGAGTGRGVKHLVDHHSQLDVVGVEPVQAMIDYAERSVGIPPGSIVVGRGQELPFPDASLDAVCELGILHHVADPNVIVEEMTRVARRAVLLSDENRFARGRPLARAAKYAIYRLGLWPVVCKLRTRGRGYVLSEGDGGVAYSYSVYDSLPALQSWADRIFLVPTVPARAGWFHPLFSATHILVCALRDT